MSKRLLVVEDSEEFRALLRMTLEFDGHDVTLAGNGREGLEAARKGTFDLIFSDIDMPEMNGLEFVRRFRAEFGATTPIIMLSGEDTGTLNNAIADGATGSLSKPFDPLGLLEVVTKYTS